MGEIMEKRKPKKIYCPGCGRKVMTYDGKHSMIIGNNCKKCRKRVVYNPENDKTEMKDIPSRSCSSGLKAGMR